VLLNDDDNAARLSGIRAIHRVLKNDSFAISFYGWPKVDLLFPAWKQQRKGSRSLGIWLFDQHGIQQPTRRHDPRVLPGYEESA